MSLQHEFSACSQQGQDGLLFEVFRHIKVSPEKYYIEFGARYPYMLNSALLRLTCGWRGLLMDPTPMFLSSVKRETVTPESVNQLFAKHGVPRFPDLLSLDLDSHEYWVWKAIDRARFLPRVVSVEATFGLQKVVTRHRDAPYIHVEGKPYHGASRRALLLLGRRLGYCLVASSCEHLIFVYCPLLNAADRDMALEQVATVCSLSSEQWEETEYASSMLDLERDPEERAWLHEPSELIPMPN